MVLEGEKPSDDTDILSNLMRGGAIAQAYLPHVEGKLLAISFITVGELYFGAEVSQPFR